MSELPQTPTIWATSPRSSTATTPGTSCSPMAVQGTTLPMGKYYPTNYEKSHPANGGQPLRPSAASPGHSFRGESSPKYLGSATHSRGSDSEAKRRLQQYQRDMIAQATLAANEVLGTHPKRSGSSIAALRNMPQLGGSLSQNPTSPDLLPMGSPGPVTPMDLEGGETSYWARNRPVSGPDVDRENDEIAKAIRAEEERRRREGATSPAVELGPLTF